MIDLAEFYKRRIDDHIATDVPIDSQLHFSIVRFVNNNRHRRAPLADKGSSIVGGDNGTFFPRLQRIFFDAGAGAAATATDAGNVNIFFVFILHFEPEFRLGSASDHAKVMLMKRK